MTVIYRKFRHMHRRGYLLLAGSGALGATCAYSLFLAFTHIPK